MRRESGRAASGRDQPDSRQKAARPERMLAAAAGAAKDSSVDADYLGVYLPALLGCVRTGRRLGDAELGASEVAGRRAAVEGIDLAALLDLYLSATWRIWPEVEREVTSTSPHGVGTAGATILRVADDAVQALARGYQSAQRLAIRREEARRRAFVDGLLTGAVDEDAFGGEAARFGFNLASAHVVVVARTDHPLADADAIHGRVEARILSSFGGRDVVVAAREGTLVCIFPGAQRDTIAGLVPLLEEAEAGPWRVGVGRTELGLGGIVRSYGEAAAAAEIALRLDLRDTPARFDELLPYVILRQARSASEELVGGVLGALASTRGGAAPLLDTLEVYLAESMNIAATARRLHLSPRAVSYRLDRISRLTGHSVRVAEQRFVLELALRAARLHGLV